MHEEAVANNHVGGLAVQPCSALIYSLNLTANPKQNLNLVSLAALSLCIFERGIV
jgi:hypothetical protein